MKRLPALLALSLFLIPMSCDIPVMETEIQGPEIGPPSYAPPAAVFPGTGEIVYTSGTASANDLFLMDLSTRTVTNLTNTTSGQNQMPEWSPSGDSIVFSARSGTSGPRELRLMSESGGSFSVLGPLFAPGTMTGHPCFDSSQPEPQSQSFPAWSHDGKHIAFICAAGLSGLGQLWVADLTPGGTWQPRFISPSEPLVSRPVWWEDPDPAVARNGKIIATVLNSNGEGGFQRDIMWFGVPWNGLPGPFWPQAGKGPITATLDVDEDNPSWKDDAALGDVIVYNEVDSLGASGEASNVYSFVMGVDAAGVPTTVNTARKQLTHSNSADYPSWTPAGNAILYTQKNGSGVFSVYLMSPTGPPFNNLVNSKSSLSLWAKMRPVP